ncbi:glycerol kinase [Deinococcus sp. Arct2-2]|uniref:FGGY family carbohydrate kinase n=1 Tax=Deinococcus sp. Arct2-2 TaxID=2568653 RepID=UPI0010A58C9E|nr:FGGY family carbohydrate kinase [Deinococcus sp. Arct2-2]THF70826.1 glycerol kinase [Deinococcus sp. Arct2-2]
MYLGLDLGTSGVTALLLGEDLEVVGRSDRTIQTDSPQPGWIEQTPRVLLAAVIDAAMEVMGPLPPGASIRAVGLANPGESVLAWDARSGDPLTPVLVWSDTRASEICERLRAQGLEPTLTELSGLPLDPYFCAAKFAWLLEHDAAVREAHTAGFLRLCTLDAWIIFQLSGQYFTDHSTASRTQLYDQVRGCWSPELLGHFGLPLGVLPEIRPSLSPLGMLNLGETQVPWHAALLDQVAALAGNGCFEEGTLKVTYGTGAFVVAQAGSLAAPAASGLLRTVGVNDAGGRTFILEGGVYSAGSAVQWLQRLGLLGHASEASALAESADGARLRFLPAFSGLGAPWWEPEARGVLAGMTAQTGKAEIVRGVLDGIASCVTDILVGMDQALPHLQRVRADGGLAQNGYLMQRQADLSGLIIERSTEHEATALGMALLAGVSAGLLSREQVQQRTRSVEVFMPRLPEAERLHERSLWKEWLAQAAALGSR